MQALPTERGDRRADLEAEIEATRESFRDLARTLPDALWSNTAAGSKWNGKQLLHHITWALEQLPQEIESAKRGKGMFNYPGFLADAGSYWLVKWEARKETRESLLRRYDAAIDRVLVSMRSVEESDWDRGARFYGEGFYSVADLLHTPAGHFEEHAKPLTGA